jgi:drug/metabolite transporter (DMT)-like permease
MTAVVLGLGAALAYGISDFIAGRLSRRMHYAPVAMIGNLFALATTVVAILVAVPADPEVTAIAWGAASGVGGALGTLMLYRGLGSGRMGVVAPLSALGAAALPVVIGVLLGDRPSTAAWAGVALALPAIWLVSTSSDPAQEDDVAGRRPLAEGVLDGLGAGVGFALLLTGLGLAGEGSGLWPVLAGEVFAVVILGLVLVGVLRGLGPTRWSARDGAGAASVGILGGLAAILYFLATHSGLLSIVAVLTSLYPAVTVILAVAILHESISRRQALGLALAVIAVGLIVAG